ncbi:MAG: terpene cyclase/mutase family protein, partial [Rhodothermales bacterium]|nr:terpene cyclase/mutase family protein [Rhodothermales bacterium]
MYSQTRIKKLPVPGLSSILLIGLMSCSTDLRPQPSAPEVLQRSVDYLVSLQDSDGGWRSPTHGFLRGGQAWTPFVLYQLAHAQETVGVNVPDTVFENGVDFIRSHVNEIGVLGLKDPDIMEYPNYSTSYALRAMLKLGSPADRELVDRMADYLLAQQYTEQRDIAPSNVAFGSWGFGEKVVRRGFVGHVDLSHTRRVIEALSEYVQVWEGETDTVVEERLLQIEDAMG